MGKKSQVSMEFFIFIGLGFIIAITFVIASIDQLNGIRARKEYDAAKDIALKLQKEILVASSVQDGYSRIFQAPDSIIGSNYSITMQNLTLAIKSKSGLYIVSIPKTSGNITNGLNIINKTNGEIYIGRAS